MQEQAVKNERARIFIRPSWNGMGGVRNLLIVGIPMILSNAVHSCNMFFDRTFLAWFSKDDFTASLQGGMVHWTVMVFFVSLVGYASTFVSQYLGAKSEHRVGPVVWQSIYLALIGGVIMACLAPLGFPFFRLIGHEGILPLLEAQYFCVITAAGGVFLLGCAFCGFYTGLGRTGLVLFISVAACIVNICLNTWMIFEPIWIFPSGIMGAAYATILSGVFQQILCVAFILADRTNEDKYRLWSGWRFRVPIFKRLIRFGVPAGAHGVIDMVGFSTFGLVVGFFGYQAQMASNMAFNVNLLLFIPAVGLHMAIQIMKGKCCGAQNYQEAQKLVSGGALVMMAYMFTICGFYIGFPEFLLGWFRGGMPEAEWIEVFDLARILLIVIAIFSTFDALVLTYSGALKGAGDTHYVMWLSLILNQLLLTLPCVLITIFRDSFESPRTGLMMVWYSAVLYLSVVSVFYLMRYRGGKWMKIRVVEQEETPQTL